MKRNALCLAELRPRDCDWQLPVVVNGAGGIRTHDLEGDNLVVPSAFEKRCFQWIPVSRFIRPMKSSSDKKDREFSAFAVIETKSDKDL